MVGFDFSNFPKPHSLNFNYNITPDVTHRNEKEGFYLNNQILVKTLLHVCLC